MIHTHDLSKVFQIGKKHKDEFTAVDGLTLDINQGEVFGFLGPNGAGKTTTVRMLACLIGVTRGSATVAGYQVGKDDTEIRRRVGILTESPGMYERLFAVCWTNDREEQSSRETGRGGELRHFWRGDLSKMWISFCGVVP